MQGATAKERKSESESSSAPNSDSFFKILEKKPSNTSQTDAIRRQITLISKFKSNEYLIELNPKDNPVKVIKLGI